MHTPWPPVQTKRGLRWRIARTRCRPRLHCARNVPHLPRLQLLSKRYQMFNREARSDHRARTTAVGQR